MNKNKSKKLSFPERKLNNFQDASAGRSIIKKFHSLVKEYHELDTSYKTSMFDMKRFKQVGVYVNKVLGIIADEIMVSVEYSLLIGWGYGRGIYEIDPTVIELLTMSDISKDTPTSVLRRLPEWVTYIRTPGLFFNDKEITGFYINYLEDIDDDPGTSIIMIAAKIKGANGVGLINVVCHSENLTDCISNKAAVIEDYNSKDASLHKDVKPNLNRYFMSIVLYVIENAIEHHTTNSKRNTNGKSKSSNNINFASKNRLFKLGEAEGSNHRERVKNALSNTNRNKPIPHLRRGHWHGYWYGSKDNKDLRLKWVAPTFIG